MVVHGSASHLSHTHSFIRSSFESAAPARPSRITKRTHFTTQKSPDPTGPVSSARRIPFVYSFPIRVGSPHPELIHQSRQLIHCLFVPHSSRQPPPAPPALPNEPILPPTNPQILPVPYRPLAASHSFIRSPFESAAPTPSSSINRANSFIVYSFPIRVGSPHQPLPHYQTNPFYRPQIPRSYRSRIVHLTAPHSFIRFPIRVGTPFESAVPPRLTRRPPAL